MKKIIIGLSGASGVIYGIRLLEILYNIKNIETHLVISEAAKKIILLETSFSLKEVKSLAHIVYDISDISASISSGSFKTMGMVVLPCSIKTLSSIVNSYTETLIARAADVMLKERRILILCIRETPLHLGHLKLMTKVVKLGALITVPVPAFYHHPKTIDDLINQTVNRILDQLDINLPKDLFTRWENK